MIYSVSEIGEMVDFLKNNPDMTIEDYRWNYSIPMIKVMGMDNSHLKPLSDEEKKKREGSVVNMKGKSVQELNNDLGVKINFPTNK